MQKFRTVRLMLLALVFSVIPASSFAGVFISVGFAPPVLPVYEQPPCPEEGLMWSPGYWAYGDDGYYWVPGAWVPAPYEGALWTPPYWGWSDGLYVFHSGYWGQTVGYYGGVNYGFGYMGIGFVGGEWREHRFAYNTAVMRVDRRIIHETYEDRRIVDRYTIRNDHRVAFSGGRDGIRHDPTPQERDAMRMPHTPPTSYQQQHFQAARADHGSYVKFNGGRPANVVAVRPLAAEHVAAPAGNGGRFGNSVRPVGSTNGPQGGRNNINGAPANRPDMRQAPAVRNEPQSRPAPSPQYQPQSRPIPETRQQPQSRPAPSPQYQPQSRPAPETRQQPQSRPAPSPQYQPQSRPAPSPQYQPQSRPAPETRQQPQARQAPAPRAEPQSRPAPAPRSEPKQKEPHN